jgi:hypothetical protein
MAGSARRTRQKRSSVARPRRGRVHGQAPRPASGASTSPPNGNAVPAATPASGAGPDVPLNGSAVPSPVPPEQPSARPGQAAVPQLNSPASAEEGQQSAGQPRQLPVKNDRADELVVSHVDAQGHTESWAVAGLGHVCRELCRVVLSFGLVVALIIVAVFCIVAHDSMLDKVLCGLGGTAVGGVVWLFTRAGRWLKRKAAGRLRKHRDKASADVDQVESRLSGQWRYSAPRAGFASQAAMAARSAVTPIQITARKEPEKSDDAQAPAAVDVIPASTQ